MDPARITKKIAAVETGRKGFAQTLQIDKTETSADIQFLQEEGMVFCRNPATPVSKLRLAFTGSKCI